MTGRIVICLLLCSALSVVQAAEQQCIQSAKRIKACPHILYRAIQLPDMPAPAIRCICVTDFSSLLVPATTEQQVIEQNMEKRRLEAELQQPLQPILDVLRK